MAQRSNFSRLPAVRTVPMVCPVSGHERVEFSEVEQFDGTWLSLGCPRCRWEALNTSPAGSDRRAQAKALLRAEGLNLLLIGSGITPRFADRSFDNFITNAETAKVQALHKCQSYADNFVEHFEAGRNLLLTGNVGNGKTHLACSIAQQVIRQHSAVAVITSAAEIIRVFKGAMERGAGYTDRDVLTELAGFDLLIIDEVGAQAGTAFELAMLHEVIDRRYNLVKPSVVISNLNPKALEQYIGERALDRLRENGSLLAGFTWASARGSV